MTNPTERLMSMLKAGKLTVYEVMEFQVAASREVDATRDGVKYRLLLIDLHQLREMKSHLRDSLLDERIRDIQNDIRSTEPIVFDCYDTVLSRMLDEQGVLK